MTQEENERLIECRQERYHLPTKIKTKIDLPFKESNTIFDLEKRFKAENQPTLF